MNAEDHSAPHAPFAKAVRVVAAPIATVPAIVATIGFCLTGAFDRTAGQLRVKAGRPKRGGISTRAKISVTLAVVAPFAGCGISLLNAGTRGRPPGPLSSQRGRGLRFSVPNSLSQRRTPGWCER
jgi:hypothetical protein